MATRLILTLVLLLLSLILFQGIAGDSSSSPSPSSETEDSYLEKCCALGSSWAKQRLRCEKFTGPVAGVPEQELTGCLEAVDICCRKHFQEEDCEQGKADAKAGLACTRDATGPRRAPIGLGDSRRDCCEGCKLGINTGSSGKSCTAKKFSLGAPWDPAFMECCLEITSGTTKPATSTSTNAITSASTSSSTPEFDPFDDLDDSSDLGNSTFSSGDLCQLLKGLLCSEICVPTPGSYYCKCRDGSKLLPDGRTCQSKTTTKPATTTSLTPRTTKAATTAKVKTTTSAPTTTTMKQPKTTKPAKKTTKPQKTTTTTRPTTTTAAPKKAQTKALTTPAKATTKATTTGAKTTKSVSQPPTVILRNILSRTTRSLSTENNELNQLCPTGYRHNASTESCDDIDECKQQQQQQQQLCISPTSVCLNTLGSYQCIEPEQQQQQSACEIGYRWNDTLQICIDVDECLEDTHKCLADSEVCKNLDGSYECEIKCGTGYIFNSNFAACLDINECTDLIGACSQPDTICINTLGSYECMSVSDYQHFNESNRLVNGPEDAHPTESTDYVIDEGRLIVCDFGTEYNSHSRRCDDIDECELKEDACAPGEICRNTPGGYDCIPAGCPRGFETISNSTSTMATFEHPVLPLCRDVDECERGLHDCKDHERCRNTNGSFTCEPLRPTIKPPVRGVIPPISCRKGYKADNETWDCVDVDECVEGPGCRDHERCLNLHGSFDCLPLCGPGWYFELQTKTCQDVDECLLGHHNCRQRTHFCRNLNGSYECVAHAACTVGYKRGPDGACLDIDECAESTHSCSREHHRYCVNREGGYECITRLPSCPRGFQYSLFTGDCDDIDECRLENPPCKSAPQERCVNLPGGYRCERPLPDRRILGQRRPACPSGTAYDTGLRRCSPVQVSTTERSGVMSEASKETRNSTTVA